MRQGNVNRTQCPDAVAACLKTLLRYRGYDWLRPSQSWHLNIHRGGRAILQRSNQLPIHVRQASSPSKWIPHSKTPTAWPTFPLTEIVADVQKALADEGRSAGQTEPPGNEGGVNDHAVPLANQTQTPLLRNPTGAGHIPLHFKKFDASHRIKRLRHISASSKLEEVEQRCWCAI
jgi:hypothetical protein